MSEWQGAESWELGAGSWGQGAGSMEPVASVEYFSGSV
jgi:hypothetical protein